MGAVQAQAAGQSGPALQRQPSARSGNATLHVASGFHTRIGMTIQHIAHTGVAYLIRLYSAAKRPADPPARRASISAPQDLRSRMRQIGDGQAPRSQSENHVKRKGREGEA